MYCCLNRFWSCGHLSESLTLLCSRVLRLLFAEGGLHLSPECAEQGTLVWRALPAHEHDGVDIVGALCWLSEKRHVDDVLHNLRVGDFAVGLCSKREDFPEEDPKGPDVGVGGEFLVLERLGGQPAQGPWEGAPRGADVAVVV